MYTGQILPSSFFWATAKNVFFSYQGDYRPKIFPKGNKKQKVKLFMTIIRPFSFELSPAGLAGAIFCRSRRWRWLQRTTCLYCRPSFLVVTFIAVCFVCLFVLSVCLFACLLSSHLFWTSDYTFRLICGRISRGHTGGRPHRSPPPPPPPSFCG